MHLLPSGVAGYLEVGGENRDQGWQGPKGCSLRDEGCGVLGERQKPPPFPPAIGFRGVL